MQPLAAELVLLREEGRRSQDFSTSFIVRRQSFAGYVS
jgi:hypothetical protein